MKKNSGKKYVEKVKEMSKENIFIHCKSNLYEYTFR